MERPGLAGNIADGQAGIATCGQHIDGCLDQLAAADIARCLAGALTFSRTHLFHHGRLRAGCPDVMGAVLAGVQNPYHEAPRLDIVIDDLAAKFGNGLLVEIAAEKRQFTARLLTVPRVAVGEHDGRETGSLKGGFIGGG
jgi:hypothetical protein